MTEAEWLKTTGIAGMLRAPGVATNARKVRLFGVGCCRQIEGQASARRVAESLAEAERFADGEGGRADLLKQYQSLNRRYNSVLGTRSGRSSAAGRAETTYLLACLCSMAPDDPSAARYTADRLVEGRKEFGPEAPQDLRKRFAELLRCISGNPFRPVTFSPSWLTETVTALADGIYAERAFDRLPILADALQEAGCEDEQVLAHCRGAGPHARGCWVVDGVLGKG